MENRLEEDLGGLVRGCGRPQSWSWWSPGFESQQRSWREVDRLKLVFGASNSLLRRGAQSLGRVPCVLGVETGGAKTRRREGVGRRAAGDRRGSPRPSSGCV